MADMALRVALFSTLVLAGCGGPYVHVKTELPQTIPEARRRLAEMAADPFPLQRPLLLIHGWRDSARRWGRLVDWLRTTTTNAERMVTVFDYAGDEPIADLTQRLFKEYEVAGEVDVVGHSMGGLITREAVRTNLIRVHMLFSMASPHEGSYLARFGSPLATQLSDMTPGSEFLERLNSDPRTTAFSVVTYWMEGDFLLTRDSAQSIGDTHLVFSQSKKPLFRYTHNQLVMDERVIWDILQRLRAEYPCTVPAPCPPAASRPAGGPPRDVTP